MISTGQMLPKQGAMQSQAINPMGGPGGGIPIFPRGFGSDTAFGGGVIATATTAAAVRSRWKARPARLRAWAPR